MLEFPPNITAVYQAILLVVLWLVLKRGVFERILENLHKRDEKTGGALAEAKRLRDGRRACAASTRSRWRKCAGARPARATRFGVKPKARTRALRNGTQRSGAIARELSRQDRRGAGRRARRARSPGRRPRRAGRADASPSVVSARGMLRMSPVALAIALAAAGTALAAEAPHGEHHAPSIGTLVLPIINFSIFAFILWRYAWPAIKTTLADRLKTVGKQLTESEAALRDARAALESIETLRARSREDGEKLIAELRAEGERQAGALLTAARSMADRIRRDAELVSTPGARSRRACDSCRGRRSHRPARRRHRQRALRRERAAPRGRGFPVGGSLVTGPVAKRYARALLSLGTENGGGFEAIGKELARLRRGLPRGTTHAGPRRRVARREDAHGARGTSRQDRRGFPARR